MKFVRQYSGETRVRHIGKQKPSMTRPNQALSIEQIVNRLSSGNTFGVNVKDVGYHSDDNEWNDEIDTFHPDPSDPLNSIAEHNQRAEAIRESIKQAEAARRIKKFEFKKIEKPAEND